jgi:proteasome accessory factor A
LYGEALLDYVKGLSTQLLSSLALSKYPQAGEFLGNGARFYIDRGGHPEYATPECSCIKELVAHEKAGDWIVQELASLANTHTAAQGKMPTLRIFKNNVDLYGHTYGGHENYLITPQADESIHHIIPFLVTRQIFTGAGRVLTRQETGAPAYEVSQRAEFIHRTYSDRSTRVRGIINTRKREIYRQEQNRRLHIIVGDSNMSEVAIGLKIGTTLLALRLLEAGWLKDIPGLPSPVDALKSVSKDWCGPFQMVGRKGRYTALDVQSLYLEKVLHFFSSRSRTPDEALALSLWEDVLKGLGQLKISGQNWQLEEDPGRLGQKVDWIRKLWLLNRYGSMNDSAVNDRRLKLIDIKYHDLDPVGGLFARCQALGLVDRLLDDAAIAAARVRPPQNTRARIRAAVIQKTADKPVDVEIENWEKITIRARRHQNGISHPFNRYKGAINCLGICLDDPFKALDPSIFERLERFIDTWG